MAELLKVVNLAERRVVVTLGSKNPAKFEGVKRAFTRFFNDVSVKTSEVDSGVPDQPFDNDTVKGAINRALKAYESEECDFGVGVEAGLFRNNFTLTGYLDIQVAAVYDGNRICIGYGPGFEYPEKVLRPVLGGSEVGKVMEAVTGIKDLGKKQGAIGYLTKNAVTRTELTEIAVIMALIPFLNRKLYFSTR